MKKRLFALLLALAMLVSCLGLMTGCTGKDADSDKERTEDVDDDKSDKGGKSDKDAGLPGEWTAELSMTEGFKAYFDEEMASQIAEAGLGDMTADDLFDLSRLNAVIEWKMVMGEDGTMTMSMSGQKMADSMRDVLTDSQAKIDAAIPSLVESIFAQQGLTMEEAEAALAAQGMSMDDLIDQTSEEMSAVFSEGLEEMANTDMNAEDSGYYIVDGDKLYVVDNKGDKPDPDDYLQFELKGDELVVTDMADDIKAAFADYEELMDGDLLPITFHRG